MKPTNTTQQGSGTTAGKTQQWNPQQQNQRPGQTNEGGLDRQQGGKSTINPKDKDTTKGGRADTGTKTGTGSASGSGKPF